MSVRNILLTTYLCVVLLVPQLALAQSSLTLSVTPTLFNMTIDPGQTWQSTIRVVNPNSFDITVYANPVNFRADGEQGRGSFVPVLEGTEGDNRTLAEWIIITEEPVRVPSQQTVEVPFIISVPADASPGGQYAAVLITTQPPDQGSGPQVRTAQAVSALFFARIEGDVIENGAIRSFRATNYFATAPENEFELRFENRGNVHLQPQGEVKIFNMWGEQRGVIPINQRSQYGNVLPESIRAFSFSWTGERSLVDIGRYRAVATIAYGSGSRVSLSQTTYFWVIPVTGLLITLGTMMTLGLIIMLLVKAYVRRMLALAGVPAHRLRERKITARTPHDINLASNATLVTESRFARLVAPIRAGWLDMTDRLGSAHDVRNRVKVLSTFLVDYKLAVLAVIVLGISISVFSLYRDAVRTSDRAFEVVVSDAEESTVITSEDIRYAALREETFESVLDLNESRFDRISFTHPVSIVNVSGQSGAAAELRLRLEEYGAEVDSIRTDLNRVEQRSVIVYNSDAQDLALALSQAFGGVLISARPLAVEDETSVVIFLGTDVLSK